MPDPSVFGWRWNPLTLYREGVVQCPHREGRANILAASWKVSSERWSPWSVIDCSLLPAGWISCDMACVPQLGDGQARPAA